MAADDAAKPDDDEPEVDPWADIVAEGLGDAGGFDALEEDASEGLEPSALDSLGGAEEDDAAEEAESLPDVVPFVDAAFNAGGDGEEAGEVFGFDAAGDTGDVGDGFDDVVTSAGAASTVEIGTGFSGIEFDEQDEFSSGSAPEASDPADADDLAADDLAHVADDLPASEDDLPTVEAGEAIAVAGVPVAGATARLAAPPQPRKGGIGQIIGIVLGALMAIPIVLGILIGLMWLGWPDKVGLRKALPQALGFLLPPKPAPVIAASPAGSLASAGAGPMSLDDVATLAGGDASLAAEGDAAGDRDAGDRDAGDRDAGDRDAGDRDARDRDAGDRDSTDDTRMPAPTEFVDAFSDADGTTPDAAAQLPGIDPLPGLDDLPAVTADMLAVADAPQAGVDSPAPGLDILDELGIGSPPPAPAPPEPVLFRLDTEALDEAAAQAGEAFAAVAEIDDFADRAGKKRLSDWYRALTRVGEELVVVEQAAADAGHPLAAPPGAITGLHDEIAAHPVLSGELGRLGRMWLKATSRDSDGIVVAGPFVTARRVGPWWISTIEIEESDGSMRELSVVSRSEPDTVAGERIVATGILFADGVVWAGDVRPAAGRGGWDAEPAVDPFADPAADVTTLPEF